MFAVKICGMRSRADVAICAGEGADALGFIFAPGPAQLELDAAAGLAACVPAHVLRVGVFAGNRAALVRQAIRRMRLDLLQFCGGETPAFCGSFGKPTIAVIGIPPKTLQEKIAMPDPQDLCSARACALLVDSRLPGRAGGTGIQVDPRMAARVAGASSLPFVLAGGLTPRNVGHAIAALQPDAVDVRSGVERGGRKDRALVREFVNAARSALGGGR